MKIKKIISILVTCVFLASAFSISVSAAIPFDNMIAMYNMEDSLTNSVTGANGTLKNGAGFVNDAQRGSVLFLDNDNVTSPGEGLGYDGEGQWAELAAPYIPDSDQMTISLWFKIKDEHRTWATRELKICLQTVKAAFWLPTVLSIFRLQTGQTLSALST